MNLLTISQFVNKFIATFATFSITAFRLLTTTFSIYKKDRNNII